eukprot:scaffold234148_cov28-Tisochrysis_lutea.AAC.2
MTDISPCICPNMPPAKIGHGERNANTRSAVGVGELSVLDAPRPDWGLSRALSLNIRSICWMDPVFGTTTAASNSRALRAT